MAYIEKKRASIRVKETEVHTLRSALHCQFSKTCRRERERERGERERGGERGGREKKGGVVS